ncbi:helix-turn-helix domain-containing protein [Streptomyces sp. MS2.AVA.5]|uniref:Helix-turn-helix domain-containing protein n=1 Tax=Streptomyces achmelvichensis TaxID=3134111 RepID=A0ACC6PM49_9ACTN
MSRPDQHSLSYITSYVAAELKVEYEAAINIRAPTEETRRSYDGVHRLLARAGPPGPAHKPSFRAGLR